MNRYLIGSGYHPKDGAVEFYLNHWLPNTRKLSEPTQVLVASDSGGRAPRDSFGLTGTKHIDFSGDLGSYWDVLHKKKPHRFNGWSGAVMLLALAAYNDEADFIYKEQDCLWFGDPVGEMYRQIGEKGIIFGSYSKMPCAQSLFMVRHAFIPEFVSTYLSSPAQNCNEELGEHKFAGFERRNPSQWCRFDFGYDRDRPFNPEDKTFYLQQVTAGEIAQLKTLNLL
jgi:hypothetical protein